MRVWQYECLRSGDIVLAKKLQRGEKAQLEEIGILNRTVIVNARLDLGWGTSMLLSPTQMVTLLKKGYLTITRAQWTPFVE